MVIPVRTPIPDHEMKRRHDLILKTMAASDVDAIVMYSYGETVAGIYKWATDFSWTYPTVSVLCKDFVAIIRSGNSSPDITELTPAEKGEQLPQILWTCPYLPGISFNNHLYGEAIAALAKKCGYKKIGWAGAAYIPMTISDYLKANLSDVEFVDFTEEMNDIRLAKSEFEIENYTKCVELHDRLMLHARSIIRPYINHNILANELMSAALNLGAIDFNTQLIGGWRGDRALGLRDPYLPGDYIWALIEVADSYGQWAECARLFRLGEEPEQKWVDISNNLIMIQHEVAKACVPGAIPEDIFRLCKDLQKSCGYMPEPRFCIHGQTNDIVDLPLFIEGDTKPLKKNMFFANHPAYQETLEAGGMTRPYFNYTDDFVVREGGAVRLSVTEQKIFTVEI